MRTTLKLIVAASLLAVLASACGQKSEEEAATTDAEQPAEAPTRTAEGPGTTTNFEEEQPPAEQPSTPQ